MLNEPAYPIRSVDHALRTALLLQHEGALRVSDIAEHLGVAGSTAHRLLQMLVHRDFAIQLSDRTYGPGPALLPMTPAGRTTTTLRGTVLPHLHLLMEQVSESVNLMVLTGRDVRFVATVECPHLLRVGDRVGRSLPAHLTSGGKALLAALPASALEELYADKRDIDLTQLRRSLSLVRSRGFAINHQETEQGVTAVGVVVRDPSGSGVAALTVAMPTARFNRDALPQMVSALGRSADDIRRALPTPG